jgi:small subunit ribosomal protein S7
MGNITASRTMLKPDPRHKSQLAGKFINCLMYDGKKTVAQSVFYGALDEIAKRVTDVEPVQVFETAIENVKPYIEVRSKRVGGASYQVPDPPAIARHPLAPRRRPRQEGPSDAPQARR